MKKNYLTIQDMEKLIGKPIYDDKLKKYRVIDTINIRFTDSIFFGEYEKDRFLKKEIKDD